MSKLEEARAALRVAELEEALVQAKDSDEASRELKLELREARQEYREKYRPSEPAEEGDATASPAAIKASARTKAVG